jgi:hypothetical protein
MFPSLVFNPGFLLRILLCSQSGIQAENYLVTFGYIIEMKIGKKEEESFYILASFWKLL